MNASRTLWARVGAAAVVAAALVSLSACGGSDDDNAVAAQAPNAAQACAILSGKTIGGATLSAAAVPASGAIPTYCKVNGTLAPKLNFEIRLPDAWNGKLHYAGGGGYNGFIPGVAFALNALKQGYAIASSDSGH